MSLKEFIDGYKTTSIEFEGKILIFREPTILEIMSFGIDSIVILEKLLIEGNWELFIIILVLLPEESKKELINKIFTLLGLVSSSIEEVNKEERDQNLIFAVCYCMKEYPQYNIKDISGFTYSKLMTMLEMVGNIKNPDRLKKTEPPKLKSKEEFIKYIQGKYGI